MRETFGLMVFLVSIYIPHTEGKFLDHSSGLVWTSRPFERSARPD